MTAQEIEEDQFLWGKFLSGDDKSYVYFYEKYTQDLFSFGMCFTADRDLVRDCIQDVFVKIYSRRSHLRKTENVKLYLFRALKNTLLNVFQKDVKFISLESVELTYSTDYAIKDVIIGSEQEQEDREKMIYVLDLLTARQKEVIHYRYVEEMSMDEICVMMNMNYQSVQNLIQRSIKKVRSSFSDKKSRTKMSIKKNTHCL